MNVPGPKITPAVLARSASIAQRHITRLARLGHGLHLDIMDGRFVPTRSFGPSALAKLRLPRGTTAHLMVGDLAPWLPACRSAGIKRVIVHAETVAPRTVAALARRFRVSVALNPETPLERVTSYRHGLSGLHLLTIHPGRQGQPFIRRRLTAIRRLRRQHPRLPISVDGGLNDQSIPLVAAAGASELIVGSLLQRARHPRAVLARLERTLKG